MRLRYPGVLTQRLNRQYGRRESSFMIQAFSSVRPLFRLHCVLCQLWVFCLCGLVFLSSCQVKEERRASHNDTSAQDDGAEPHPEVTLEELRQLVEGNTILLLDVRPQLFYDIGHIPSSKSLPNERFETAFQRLKPSLDQAISAHKKVILYCSGSYCTDSTEVAGKLSQAGYRTIHTFKGGWEEWKSAGLAEESIY